MKTTIIPVGHIECSIDGKITRICCEPKVLKGVDTTDLRPVSYDDMPEALRGLVGEASKDLTIFGKKIEDKPRGRARTNRASSS